jgi:hypothetical protein
MTGLEGPAGSVAFKLAVAAGRRFARTTEFERLCARLANRFGDRTPYGPDDYAVWSRNDAFSAALGRLTSPPHEFDREALVAAIVPLVGALDEETPAAAFAGLVADAVRDELRIAKTGDDLVRLESDRIVQALEAGSRGRDRDADLGWVPSRAQHVVRRLLRRDSDGFERLRASLAERDLVDELRGLVGDPPEWLVGAGTHVWESIARLCEVTGLWPEALRAYSEAAERPGADRGTQLMAASAAAGYAGDKREQKALRERAQALPGTHPMVQLVAISEEQNADERLRKLADLDAAGDDEIGGLIERVRAIALLDVGDIDAAERAASAAMKLAPWSIAVREAPLAVVLARNRERRGLGRPTERRQLIEAAEEFRQLRDELRTSRRYSESGGMLEVAAEALNLADRPDLATVMLSEALDEELARGDVALALAQTALESGDPDLAEVLLERYSGDHKGADVMRAQLSLRHAERRQEAVASLDTMVDERSHEAAFVRLIAAVPATDEVPWSESAEALVRDRAPVIASFMKSEWHLQRGRVQEANRELARHADDPRALKELMVRFASEGELGKAAASARAVLSKETDLDTQLTAARVLEAAGDAAQAEATLRKVINNPDAHEHERRRGFDQLAHLLIRLSRMREAQDLAESLVADGYAEAGWVAAYVLARSGRLREARERMVGLDARDLADATLAVDLAYAIDPPAEALGTIIALADALDEPNENIELKATLTLLRAPPEAVTEELIERAGPVSFVERFPSSTALWRQRIDGDEQAIEMLREQARRRAAVADAAQSHVLVTGDRPVGTLAYAVGRTLAEVWAELPMLPLGYEDQSLDAETAHAGASLGGPVVVETGALHSLHLLGADLAELVLAELPLSITAQATVEDLIQATMPTVSTGEEVARQVTWDPAANDIAIIEMPAEQAAAGRTTARAMQQLAVRLQPAPGVELPNLNEEGADSPVVRAYPEIAELARQAGYTVYSDDRWFRKALAVGGVPSFGTVSLLEALRRSHAIDDAQHAAALQALRARGALGIRPDDA